jgi:hypothetical protein
MRTRSGDAGPNVRAYAVGGTASTATAAAGGAAGGPAYYA